MSIHSALQVFHPLTKSTSDGLYPCRLYVYLGAFAVPSLMAGLAFVNPGPGYESLGAFCTLPIRPFWYRLALAWIPRYLIAFTIIGLAISIKKYVDLELDDIDQSILTSQTTQIPRTSSVEGPVGPAYNKSKTMQEDPRNEGKSSNAVCHGRSECPPSNPCANFCSCPVPSAPGASTDFGSDSAADLSVQRANSNDPIRSTLSACCRCGLSVDMTDLWLTSPFRAPARVDTNDKPPVRDAQLELERHNYALNESGLAICRSTQVRRQLHLVFIYPLVYTLMWLIPFAHHCTMYNDNYAHRPLWALRLGATVCVSSMGLIDCLVFFLRERPWQRIPTSDGTFLGSFAIWK